MNCKVWQIIHEETSLYQVLPMALYDLIILGQDVQKRSKSVRVIQAKIEVQVFLVHAFGIANP